MKKTLGLLLAGCMIYLAGCVKKDFDVPPIGTLPVGTVYTLSDMRQMFADSGGIQINYDASVYGTITADESSGNLYKNAYIQDPTDAVDLHLTASGGFRTGDSVRIYLRGIVLNEYGGAFQLDNVNADSNQVIIANQKYLEPTVVTIPELNTGAYESQLIQLENIQFTSLDTGNTWAIPDGYGERYLEDCNGESVMVRTSSYANFGDLTVPSGNGTLIAIAGSYNGTVQLIVRTISEVDMNGERCDGGGGTEPIDPVASVEEYFDDAVDYTDIEISGWLNVSMAGNRLWQGKSYQSEKYAQATAYNSGLDDMETWLVTPPVINTSGEMILRFKSAMAFWAHQSGNKPFTVLASTDYDGTNLTTAIWTELDVTLADESSGDNNWVSSGDYSLSAFTGNVAIAFKYKGSSTESTSYRIDDVIINDQGGGGGGITPVDQVDEKFDDAESYTNIAIEGWSNLVVEGTRYWQGKVFDTEKYAQATGYNSGLDAIETWLITPPVINTSGDKTLSFKNAMAYWAHTGQPLTVLASTDYDGTNFETSTWTELSPVLAGSGDENYAWVESGEISLEAFIGNVAIAFKYTGSDTESTSIEIDDVLITDGGGGGGDNGVTSINEDFESFNNYDEIDIPGWINTMIAGTRSWQAKEYDANLYAQATSYNSGENNDTWLITPKIDLPAMSNPVFEFDNAQAYWVHDGLSVLISTDFDGTNVEDATWETLDCNLAGSGTPDHEWVNSGKIYLSGYSQPAYIAFRYVGSDPDETTSYRLDNILLYDE